MAFSDERGYKRVYLWTFEGSGAGRRLYEAHGFALVHQQAGRTRGKLVNEQRVERSAASPLGAAGPPWRPLRASALERQVAPSPMSCMSP